MKMANNQLAIPAALIFYLNLTQALSSGESADTLLPGCSLRLSGRAIEIVFPDGSMLTTPRDTETVGHWTMSASGGMAARVLSEASAQLVDSSSHRPSDLPSTSYLEQNHPNPFNPVTTIDYTIAGQDTGGARVRVKLQIFNLRGQLVRTLVNDFQEPGQYSFYWQGQDNEGENLGSGVYLCRLLAGNYVASRKMVLAK